MLSIILSWIGSLLGGPFAKAALDAYRAKLQAQNSSERITAELAARELAVEQREAELSNQLLIVEQGNWLTRWVRPLWAFPFVVYSYKIVIWDIILGWGSTDPIRGDMGKLMMIIAAAYFGGRSIETLARILKR
jgi:hypothetical protein